MITHVKKWGNSLAIRIPRLLATDLGIEQNSSIQIESKDGTLVVTPIKKPRYELSDLLEQINASNLHAEIDTGQSQGVEIW